MAAALPFATNPKPVRRGVDLAKRRGLRGRPASGRPARWVIVRITAAVAHPKISARAGTGGQSTAHSGGRWPRAATNGVDGTAAGRWPIFPRNMSPKPTLNGRALSDDELERIRDVIERLDTICIIDDEVRKLVASQWPHLLAKLPPERPS